MIRTLTSAALVAAIGLSLASQRAEACGCFAPPDPTVPIVQAGERILFAVENGNVTAHIQIQYSGDAKDFGWLLPLPSQPTLKLGTEELFTQLINTTQPRYFVNTTTNGNCNGLFFGALASRATPAFAAGAAEDANGGAVSPLVTQASIGPYDYAVLRADSKDLMFQWLTDNHYFIPTGTDQTVGPYIHAGGFFLALKLKSGMSAGDIQPVVLEYKSDLPMIPIILTSVAANPNMGIQVWMLGNGRAIPRNYNHVVVNDAQIDWLNQAKNYNDVVIAAVGEAPEKHAFVTEYAGTSAIMRNLLNAPNRFGNTTALAQLTDPTAYVSFLFDNGFTAAQLNPNNMGFSFFAPTLLPNVRDIMIAAIPMPEGLKAAGIKEDDFLRQIATYLSPDYRQMHPDQFTGWVQTFDPQATTAKLNEKVIGPTLEAGSIFNRFPTMTRLYTTLSPEDMTRDPVFSYNPGLPEVSRDHTANLKLECGLISGNAQTAAATLTTEQGWVFHLDNQGVPRDLQIGPAALRIETLREEGAPEILKDNQNLVRSKVGCSAGGLDLLGGLSALSVLGLLRRRRQAAAA
ncbi:MAG: DUF2330 domain-containing protein [Myxococcaceae bacterium]